MLYIYTTQCKDASGWGAVTCCWSSRKLRLLLYSASLRISHTRGRAHTFSYLFQYPTYPPIFIHNIFG